MIAILACLAPGFAIAMYDRYLVPVLPLTLLFLTRTSVGSAVGHYRGAAAAATSLALAVFSVLSAHDYMAWNRARWAAIADLEKAGIASSANLDGGFEYNGRYSYDPSYHATDEKSWWWINKDDYQIAFGPIDGMKIIMGYTYHTLLPPAKRFILVLRK